MGNKYSYLIRKEMHMTSLLYVRVIYMYITFAVFRAADFVSNINVFFIYKIISFNTN